MPATFESFGFKFLYPDNWTLAERDADSGEFGTTLELPKGGFFSIELDEDSDSDAQCIARAAEAIHSEYPEAEQERIDLPSHAGLTAVDFTFFYLDMLIVSRMIVLNQMEQRWILQIQAESRDFEKNEIVFEAILKQIVEGPPMG